MKTVHDVQVKRLAAIPEDDKTIGDPECLWIEWTEEYVVKSGPHAGRNVRSTSGMSIPREAFMQAHRELFAGVD